MTPMAVPQELVRIITFFSDPSTLATMCLSSRAFCFEARTALYTDISFRTSTIVERFLLSARHHLNLVKHLSLYIPLFSNDDVKIWSELFIAVHQDSNISLRLSSPTERGIAPTELKDFADNLLSLSSLKYVAVSTSVVSAAIAVQCPTLKELDVRVSPEWDQELLTKISQDEKPKLNTLCFEAAHFSLPLVQNLLDISSVRRLAVVHALMDQQSLFQLLEMTSETLVDLSLWVHSTRDKAYIMKLHKLAFPNLQTFTLLFNRSADIDQGWSECDTLVSTLVSISGEQFEELRLYLHCCDPSTILKGRESAIPHFHSRIRMFRLYCWYSDKPPAPRVAEAERILQRRLGKDRDFLVLWCMCWTSLTHFGEPRERVRKEALSSTKQKSRGDHGDSVPKRRNQGRSKKV
ncbi:hypothetical protein DL96DRAFT_1609793 [Flagelloscypha sp. PMI_526]|nr:hypothetical protein DL96DRAFT_1609793 [Flagelloscypha sp. PMI_526]